MEREMSLFVNHFSDHFNDLTLKYFIIIDKPLDQKLEFSCLLLINDGREDVMDEVLKTRFIEF